MPLPTMISALITVLDEAIDGPADPKTTWFTTNAPGSGLLGALAGITAEQASRKLPMHQHTIASHAAHTRFGLAAASLWLTGEHLNLDWDTSWVPTTVSDAGWRDLQAAIARDHGLLRHAMQGVTADSKALCGAIGSVAHVAYHLGAIRQLIPLVADRRTIGGGTAAD